MIATRDTTPATGDAAQKARAGWFQCPKWLIQWLPYLDRLQLSVVLIILFFQNMSKKNVAYPGLKKIAELLGHKDVKRASAVITGLVRGKLLLRIKEGGGRESSVYRVNPHVDPADSTLCIQRPPTGTPSPTARDTQCRQPSPTAREAASPTKREKGNAARVAPSPTARDQFRPIELDLLKRPEEKRLGGTAAAVFSNGEKMGEELRKKAGDSLDEIAATLEMYGIKVTSKTPWVETVFLGIPAAQAIDVISECLRGELTAPIPVRVNLIKTKAPGIIKRIAAREAQKLEQAERTRLEAEQERGRRRQVTDKLRAELLERFNADQSDIVGRKTALEADGLWDPKYARVRLVEILKFTPDDSQATFGDDAWTMLLIEGGEGHRKTLADIAARKGVLAAERDKRERAEQQERDRLATEAKKKADAAEAANLAEQEAAAEKLRERHKWVSSFSEAEFAQVQAAFFERYPTMRAVFRSKPALLLQEIHDAAIKRQFIVPSFPRQLCKTGGANGHQ